MADAVTTRVVYNDKRLYKVWLTGVSDGTGEAAVAKLTKASLVAQGGAAPTSISILGVKWVMQGYTSVTLAWDATTDDVIIPIGPGIGDFTFADGPATNAQGRLDDPISAGNTGNIVLTTVGHSAGDTYAILLTCLLNR